MMNLREGTGPESSVQAEQNPGDPVELVIVLAERPRDVSALLWLWAPLAFAISPYVAFFVNHDFHDRWFRHEYGIIETATALALFGALWSGVRLTLMAKCVPGRWMRPLLIVLTLGILFFAGEEVSWGQHWFGWDTPEGLARINEQGETNLHNIGGWTEALLDQGPRSLLTLAALVGGVLVPLFLRPRRNWGADSYKHWLWPTFVCAPASVLALTVRLPKKLIRELEPGALGSFGNSEVWQVHGGESKELFLAFFLLIYLRSLSVRWGAQVKRTEALGSVER